MGNLEALIYGKKLNNYQLALALNEFEKIKKHIKQTNKFILNIAEILNIKLDDIKYDEIQWSLDNFQNIIKIIKEQCEQQKNIVDVNNTYSTDKILELLNTCDNIDDAKDLFCENWIE